MAVGALSFCLLLIAGASVCAQEALAPPGQPPAAPPTREQKALWALMDAAQGPGATSADQARLLNATTPYSTQPIEAARPFRLAASLDRQRAVECLAQAIYYEAGREPLEGQRAVAQVVLNRVRHPAFPKTVCGVVYQGAPAAGCQFSFACDGSLQRAPSEGDWRHARIVAADALSGYVARQVGEATHYHADYVAPYWAPTLTKVSRVGAHIFYRWPGGAGEPAAFTDRYAGAERAVTPVAPRTPVLAAAERTGAVGG